MTSADLNIYLSEKWPKWLRTGSLRAVDRRITRPSSFPSFRVRGGDHFGPPPPPPWRRWLRPPPGRGLKGLSHLVQSCLLYLSCLSKYSARSTSHVDHFFLIKYCIACKKSTLKVLTLASGGGLMQPPISFSELDAKPFGVSRWNLP